MFNSEIEIVKFIQLMRNEYFDIFFKILNIFDTPIFFYFLIPIIWFGYNRKFGLKLTFILIISSIINEFLKNIFQIPRPFNIDPSLYVINLKGFAFPSGGAQKAILLPFIFINEFKEKKWPIIVGLFFFLFISLSRIYLGLHYLSDIIGGWIIGFLVFLIYKYIFPIFEKFLENRPIWFYWIYQIIVLPFLFFSKTSVYAFAFLGVFFGMLLSEITHLNLLKPKNFIEFFLRSVFVMLGIFILYFFYKITNKKFMFFDLLTLAYLVGIWISFICPFLFLKIFKNYKKH